MTILLNALYICFQAINPGLPKKVLEELRDHPHFESGGVRIQAHSPWLKFMLLPVISQEVYSAHCQTLKCLKILKDRSYPPPFSIWMLMFCRDGG